MKLKNTILSAVLLAFGLVAGGAAAATYDIDASHSSVNFQIRHLAISKVNGNFAQFEGAFVYDEGKPGEWTAEATIYSDSVDTDNDDRDKHLKSPDFFNAEKFPTITFKSTGMKDGKLDGELTMLGVTKPVEMDLEFNGAVTDPWGNHRVSFTATGTVNRKDYGMTFNKALDNGGLMLGEDVKFTIEIEGIQQK